MWVRNAESSRPKCALGPRRRCRRGAPSPRVTMWYRADNVAGSILRQGEDHAWRCNAAERMCSERDQRRLRLGGKRAGHEDRLAQRFAQPLQPADQVDGGADGGEIQAIRRADIAPENLAKMQSGAER